jgi:hypothetical protein
MGFGQEGLERGGKSMLSVGQVWEQGRYRIQIIFTNLPDFVVKCIATGSDMIWRVGDVHGFKAKGLSLQECANFLLQNGWKVSSHQESLAACYKCNKTFTCLENGSRFLCYSCEINQ